MTTPNQALQQTERARQVFGKGNSLLCRRQVSAVFRRLTLEVAMRNEFTAVIKREDDWHIGYCPEISGANGQGHTVEECSVSLAEAFSLILENRREEGLRGVPDDAIRATVTVE